MTRLDTDLASDEITATLSEDVKLAGAMSITGMPAYVVGSNVVSGAVGPAALKGWIATARGHGVN